MVFVLGAPASGRITFLKVIANTYASMTGDVRTQLFPIQSCSSAMTERLYKAEEVGEAGYCKMI